MSLINVAFLFLVTIIAPSVSVFVCPQNYCKSVECVEVTNCSGVNQVVKRGGFCSCCHVCYTVLGITTYIDQTSSFLFIETIFIVVLGENESCMEQILIGGLPPTETCGENLVCYEQKCQKVENVIKKYRNNNHLH